MIGFNYGEKILTFKPHVSLIINRFGVVGFFLQVELLLSGYFWKIRAANYVNYKK